MPAAVPAERSWPGSEPGPAGQPGPGHPAGERPRRPRPAQGREASRRARAASRRKAAWAIGVAAVVVLALVAVLILHLEQGGSQPNASKLTARSHSPAVTAAPTPSATLGLTTPTGFSGTWSGPVTQDQTTFTAKITLTSGQSSGSIAYTGADFSCSGDLSLTSATASTVTMGQTITVGQSQCINGTVSLALTAAGSMSFNFKSESASAGPATGTLTHQ